MPKGVYQRSESQLKGYWLGKKRSADTCTKLSLARIGKALPEAQKIKIRENAPRGKDHKLWKGDDAGYVPIHSWVVRYRGKPLSCEYCGKSGGNSRNYHWANVDHKYKRDLSDYIRLCVSCHRKYDIEKGHLTTVFGKVVKNTQWKS